MKAPRYCAAMTALILMPASTVQAQTASKDVNVYTYREPELIKPLFEAFTKETGIKVNMVFAKDGLEQRLATEGASSPADVLLTVDIGRLQQAVDLGVTQPVNSDTLKKAIPASLRDPQDHWFALTMRGRVVYASKERVKETNLTYEQLADPKWKGKICIRSGKHMYNNALISAFVAKHGEAKTKSWLEGIKANLARKPAGGDRDVAKDIQAGLCDIGLGNTYYVALMQNDAQQKAWAEAIKVILPNFEKGGTHVNISGAVLAKHAPNKQNGIQLIEWLVSPNAQALYASQNFEYPVREGVVLNNTVQGWGALKPDTTPLSDVAKNRKTAAELIDKTGFDN